MKDRKGWAVEVGRTVFATIIAVAGAAWGARGIFADLDRRVTVVETKQESTDKQVAASLTSIDERLRDLNTAVLQQAGQGGKR
jgi:hypothetical protein